MAIELGVEATPEWIQAPGADTVGIATGAHWEKTGETPSRPDRHEIPGIDSPIVKDAGTAVKAALADPKSLGGRVLIVDDGAGYVPFGLAELLVDNGIAVEVISPQLLLGEDLLKSLDMPHVFPRLVAKGVKLTPQTFVDEINGSSVTYGFIWGGARTTAEFDTVVIAMHKAPNAELYFALKGRRVAPRRGQRGAAQACRDHLRGREARPRDLAPAAAERRRAARNSLRHPPITPACPS